MDVQSESCEPLPCDTQPAGKIKKGFKLFGKRRTGSGVGSIFSVRNKGEGDSLTQSAIERSSTLDGLRETVTQDSAQRKQREHDPEPEVSKRRVEAAEREREEPAAYDGTHFNVPPRPSISSITSAKSLGFLSLLRGGQHGGKDRHVHTISQPATRQRRGLKGLFGSVRWHHREKGTKEESPPSPPLMLSRTSSVEIIKEDLTLTPLTPPRTMDNSDLEPEPETLMSAPAKSPDTPEGKESVVTVAVKQAADSVSRYNFQSVPTSASPPDPVVDRLSSLLADISSLISFDSLIGCGDIIADVEAEWGKSSIAVGGTGTGAGAGSGTMGQLDPINKFTPSSTLTPAPTNFASTTLTPTTKVYQSFAPSTKITPHITLATKSALTFPITKPSPILTTTGQPTITTHIVTQSPALAYNIKPTHCPDLTPTSTPTPPPPPVRNSPSISPFCTSADTEEPSPVASPQMSTVFKLAPVNQSPPSPTKLASLIISPKLDLTAESSFPKNYYHTPIQSLSGSNFSHNLSTSTAPLSSPAPCLGPAQISYPTLALLQKNPLVSTTSSAKIPVPKTPTPNLVSPPETSSTPSTGYVDSTNYPPTQSPVRLSMPPPTFLPTPSLVSETKTPLNTTSASVLVIQPSPALAFSQAPTPLSVLSTAPTSAALVTNPLTSSNVKDRDNKTSVDRGKNMAANGMEVQSNRTISYHQEEQPGVPHTEKKNPPVKTMGVSKIPVVEGGRPSKLPLQKTLPSDNEGFCDLPTHGQEGESSKLIQQHMEISNSMSDPSIALKINSPTAKPSPEERQLHQPKSATSIPRDSKIPVKQAVSTHSAPASQIPVAKDPYRTKIPISKVPVRRVCNRPTAASTRPVTEQLRK